MSLCILSLIKQHSSNKSKLYLQINNLPVLKLQDFKHRLLCWLIRRYLETFFIDSHLSIFCIKLIQNQVSFLRRFLKKALTQLSLHHYPKLYLIFNDLNTFSKQLFWEHLACKVSLSVIQENQRPCLFKVTELHVNCQQTSTNMHSSLHNVPMNKIWGNSTNTAFLNITTVRRRRKYSEWPCHEMQ